MTRHPAAPMPEGLRHYLRAGQHPARSLPCPWCQALPHKPCRIPAAHRDATQVHQQRMAAWARTVACCPTCQVTPTVPCHADGRALEDGAVHARRYEEAEATAA
jgi:hypothetical protein